METKEDKKFSNLIWMLGCLLFFIIGIYVGSVIQQQAIISGLVRISEGLEGTNFELNVDFNETQIVETALEYFNETWYNQTLEGEGK